MADQYIVLCGSVVGNMSDGFEVIYDWDGQFHAKRKDAICNGWKQRESDDFNIGIVRDGRLIALCWMNEPNKETAETLREVEEQIGLYDEEEV